MGKEVVAVNAKIFEAVWERGNYRLGSTAERLIPFITSTIPSGVMINDYGAGTGRADVKLASMGYKVNMIEFAKNAVEKEAMDLIGKGLTLTVAPLWDLPESVPVAEWGICINVLMTVDPTKLNLIQKEMRRTCKNLIVEVYDWPDIRLGMDLTSIKMDADGWANEMKKYWPVVEKYESPEHRRRYITVCRTALP